MAISSSFSIFHAYSLAPFFSKPLFQPTIQNLKIQPIRALSDPFVLQIAETFEDSLPLSSQIPSIQKLRDTSSQSLLSTSWPTRKDEPFRFFDTSSIKQSQIKPISTPSTTTTPTELAHLEDTIFPNLVFIDGHIVNSSKINEFPTGVYVGSASDIDNEVVKKRVFEFVSEFQDGDLFWSLNGIGAPDVTVVYVPAECKVESPLHLMFFSSESGNVGSNVLPVSNPRVLVLVEKGGEIGIIEEYFGGDDSQCYWVNSALEVLIESGGKVVHSYVQRQGPNSAHTKWTFVRQKMVQLSQAQFDAMLAANQQGIAQAVQQAIQAVVPLVQGGNTQQQGAQAGNGAQGGGGGDPFAKRLKAFSDVGVEKYTGNEGVLESKKWLDHALRMLEQMESLTTERARRELLTHQMAGNALGWWKTQERILGAQGLADLTVAQFKVMFEDRYVPEQHKRRFRQDFLRFEQGERTVEQYTSRFHELSIFAPGIADNEEDMKAMYVEGLRRSIRHVMPSPDECTMTQLYNRAIRAERDDFKPKRAGTGGSKDRYRPYDQPRQGGGRGRDRYGRGGGRHGRGGFHQGNRDHRAIQAQPVQARQQPLALPAPVLAAHGGQQQGQRACHRCGDVAHFVRDCPWYRDQNGRLVPRQRQQQYQQPQPQQFQPGQGGGRGGGRGGDRGGGRHGGRGRGRQQQQEGRGLPVLAAIPGANLEAQGDFQVPGHGGIQQDGIQQAQ